MGDDADPPAAQLVATMREDGTATVQVTTDGEETFAWRGSVADFAPVAQQAVQSEVETYADRLEADAVEEPESEDISPKAATPE